MYIPTHPVQFLKRQLEEAIASKGSFTLDYYLETIHQAPDYGTDFRSVIMRGEIELDIWNKASDSRHTQAYCWPLVGQLN